MHNKIESIEDVKVYANKTLEKWQCLLGLNDWHIDIYVDEAMELNDEGTIGQIDYNEFSKIANIRLADPSMDFEHPTEHTFVHSNDWLDCDIETGIERTIIHELLHLDFDYACEGYDQKEEAINRMTAVLQSLVTLD